jgi:hypothetical protein
MNMSFKKIFYYVDITKNQYFQTNQRKEIVIFCLAMSACLILFYSKPLEK